MTVGIHIARVGYFMVDSLGNIILKNSNETSINRALSADSDHRIIPNSSVPNSNNYPTVSAYLEAEADVDYVLQYMDQNAIITYLRDASGGFPAP